MIKKILVSVVLLTFFALPGYAKASSISVVWFPVVSGSIPHAIVPDTSTGGVWFGMDLLSAIGHMDAQGNVQYYRVDRPVASLGRDKSGNIWFSFFEHGMGFIDSHSKAITTYKVNGYNLTYTLGAMWFLTGAHGYGSITSKGEVRYYKLPQDFNVNYMAAGPDGNLWITDIKHSTIGKVLPGSGLVTAYALPANEQAWTITSGPDGALWFVTNPQGIGRITTTGKITLFQHYTYATGDGDIKSGPNNTLWFVFEDGGGSIAYMTTSGKITVGNSFTGRWGEGNYARVGNVMWFTDEEGDRVGHTV